MQRLWDIVASENITVRYKDLSRAPEKVHGLYLYGKQLGPLIILDKHIEHSYRLFKCVLAEEIGHYYTNPRTDILTAHTSANLKAMQSQDEKKAMQWATDFLCPNNELEKALKAGCRDCFELAEYFDVTEWFMYRKMDLLETCFRRVEFSVQPCNSIS